MSMLMLSLGAYHLITAYSHTPTASSAPHMPLPTAFVNTTQIVVRMLLSDNITRSPQSHFHNFWAAEVRS